MEDIARKDKLREKIVGLGPWLMRHEVEPGVYTEVAPGSAGARQKEFFDERGKLAFSFLKNLYGGNLQGRTVLDIGCASGFFSFMAARENAGFVRGIDAREAHIKQANFLKDNFKYNNCVFEQLRIDRLVNQEEGFDCVLMLDVLQLLPNTIQVMDYLYKTTRQVLILDVPLFRRPRFLFTWPKPDFRKRHLMILCDERQRSHNKCGVDKLAFLPTYSAVITLLKSSGFEDVFQLSVPRRWMHPGLPLTRYTDGREVIFAIIKDKGLLDSIDLSRSVRVYCKSGEKANYSTWGPNFKYTYRDI